MKNKKRENVIDVRTPEGKELLLQFVGSVQRVDNQIKLLQQERKDILNRTKEEGFNKSMITKAIKEIRGEQSKKDNVQEMESDIYYTLIKESGIVQ